MASKSILSVDDLSDGDLDRLFCETRRLKASGYKKKWDAVLMTAFFEPSTRTRLSFEMAAHRLGLRVSTFDQSSSSMLKGEGILETIANLQALGPDILVIRSKIPLVKTAQKSSVINGGDGTNEHPSQALLDCFTLLEHFNADDLSGKNILFMGDIIHSRVAKSNIKLLKRLKAHITLLSPSQLMPELSLGEDERAHSFAELSKDYSAIMCLRLQKERIEGAKSYPADFSLNLKNLEKLGQNCAVLHPGPMNIGEEIALEVANSPQSLIYRQVENGVPMRAALINHCLS